MYLNYWGPQNAKVFACLTVPRQAIMGFAERVMSASAENDNRPDYARLHLSRTLIAVREAQMHQLAIRYGMTSWMMPGTDPARARSEFFKGTLQQALRAQGCRRGRSVHVCWQQHQPDHKADFEKRRCHRDSASATPQIRALG